MQPTLIAFECSDSPSRVELLAASFLTLSAALNQLTAKPTRTYTKQQLLDLAKGNP